MKILNTLFTTLILLFAFQANAQAQEMTVLTEDMTVQMGDNFEFKVMVEDFDEVVTAQFPMFWDPSIIEYVGVTEFGLPNMTVDGNFGEMNIAQGKLRFNWIDPDPMLNGVTLNDGASLFTIVFKAVGGPAQSTTFEVADDLVFPEMVIEVINANSNALNVNIINSTITMDGVSSSFETKTSDFILMQNSPNPFTEETNITFALNQSSDTQLSIFDPAGKLVFEQSKTYSGGSHTVSVNRSLFQSTGSYFYTLKTENATATRQLIVQ